MTAARTSLKERDQLVIAHQITCRWPHAGDAERVRLRLVAEDCLKT